MPMQNVDRCIPGSTGSYRRISSVFRGSLRGVVEGGKAVVVPARSMCTQPLRLHPACARRTPRKQGRCRVKPTRATHGVRPNADPVREAEQHHCHDQNPDLPESGLQHGLARRGSGRLLILAGHRGRSNPRAHRYDRCAHLPTRQRGCANQIEPNRSTRVVLSEILMRGSSMK
jgi:hypothetical protein